MKKVLQILLYIFLSVQIFSETPAGLKYTDIMVDAVVNSGVPLMDSAVGEFLLNLGYIGRRRASIISEVIDKAKVSQKRVD